jgi:hypothetical protein
MSRNALTIVVVAALVVYGLYIGSYIPAMLVGSPPAIILIGFVVQTMAAIVGAAGVWWGRSWAPAVIVILGVAIAATAIVEGYVLGLIAYNHALAVAVLGLALTIGVAVYLSRNRVGAPLQARG